jgi:hypothetical protein
MILSLNINIIFSRPESTPRLRIQEGLISIGLARILRQKLLALAFGITRLSRRAL